MRPFFLLFLTLPSLALANEGSSPGVSSGSFLQAMLGLSLIIALLFLFAFLARKFLGGKGFGQGGMKLLGGIALGPRERIVLVEAGDQWLVVGIVPGQIRTLHTMPRGELSKDTQPDLPPFSHWMKQMMDRQKNEK